MMCKRLLILVTLLTLLAGQPVSAIIPLELVAEFELPPNNDWDVQHWLNDSTYGWACLDGDSVRYCLDVEIGESGAFFVPLDYDQYQSFRSHLRVFIYGPSNEDSVTVAVVSRWTRYDEDYHRVTKMHVDPPMVILPEIDWQLFSVDSWCGAGYFATDMFVWPPPPLSAEILIEVGWRSRDCDYPGFDIGLTYGVVFRTPLSEDSGFDEWWGNAHVVVPFADFSERLFYAYSHWHEEQLSDFDPEDPDLVTSYSRRRIVGDWMGPVETICEIDREFTYQQCPTERPLATVQASDGTRRIVLNTGVCLIDSSGYFVPDWENPDLNGVGWHLHSGILPGSLDEQIFSNRSGQFIEVFNAADGSWIDCTSDYEGEFQYVLKQPNRVSEFVTYDDSTRIAHIYRPGPREPVPLTLIRVSDTDNLQINWPHDRCATSYSVFMNYPPPLNEPYFIATTTDTLITVPIPDHDIGFFWVEVNP